MFASDGMRASGTPSPRPPETPDLLGFTITNNGSGYTSQPTVVIDAPAGQAAATSALNAVPLPLTTADAVPPGLPTLPSQAWKSRNGPAPSPSTSTHSCSEPRIRSSR